MTKFFNTKIYIIGGSKMLRNRHDAEDYCAEHGLDFKTAEVFDSRKEYDRYRQLSAMQDAGEIRNLQRQVRFEIIPGHKERVVARNKKTARWICGSTTYATKREAMAHRKEQGVDKADICKIVLSSPVFKEVTIEQPHYYTADFVYHDADGRQVVEDVKSSYTRKEADYILRRALMYHRYGIKIKEIV